MSFFHNICVRKKKNLQNALNFNTFKIEKDVKRHVHIKIGIDLSRFRHTAYLQF